MRKLVVLFALASFFAAAVGAAPLAQNQAYVLLQSLPLYQDNGAKLTWVEALTIGDVVALLNRTAKFKVDGQDLDYVRVKAPDGKEGWVRPIFLAAKASLAVVKSDQAVVYSEPRDVKVTSKFISGMTLVAVLADGSTADFVKVQGYDLPQKRLFSDAIYVSPDDLTTSDVDVNAVILYTVALSSADARIKQSLLKVAATKYAGSLFISKIQGAAGIVAAAPRATVPSVGTYVITSDNVNVRANPDENAGQVVGKLMKGAQVTVKEMTKDTYTVAGSTSAWYHVADPDGWVFGAFLEPAP